MVGRVAGQVEGLGRAWRHRVGIDEERFHAPFVGSSAQAVTAGRGSGRALELGHLGLVVGPLGPLVADEPLEHVLPQRLGHELRSLHHVEALESDPGSESMPSAMCSSAVS